MKGRMLQQSGIELLTYFSVTFLALLMPFRAHFFDIAGLSLRPGIPFLVIFALGVIFVAAKEYFSIRLKQSSFTRIIAGVIAGIIVGIIINLPLIITDAQALIHARSSEGFLDYLFSNLFFLTPILAVSLFFAAIIGFIQSIGMHGYQKARRRGALSIACIALFTISGLLVHKEIRLYHRILLVGCPDFTLNLSNLLMGSSCVDQASVKMQHETLAHKVPELKLQFQYPAYWGRPNFYAERGRGDTGKTFSMPFGVYYSLNELQAEGLVVEGWKSGFNEPTCTFTDKGINFIVPLQERCNDIERIETPYGTIFYYHAPVTYQSAMGAVGNGIRPNDGVAIIRLPHPQNQIMFIRKLLDTQEKEEEFKNFLRSFNML